MSAPRTTIRLSTGEPIEVAGTLDEVAKALENAARSGPGMLARLAQASDGSAVAVNPAQVVIVRAAPAGAT